MKQVTKSSFNLTTVEQQKLFYVKQGEVIMIFVQTEQKKAEKAMKKLMWIRAPGDDFSFIKNFGLLWTNKRYSELKYHRL